MSMVQSLFSSIKHSETMMMFLCHIFNVESYVWPKRIQCSSVPIFLTVSIFKQICQSTDVVNPLSK